MDFKKEDRIISDFLNSIGPWKEHVVLGGGYALIVYKMYLVDQMTGHPPIGTRDLDSLISRKIPEISNKNLHKYLLESGFEQYFKDLKIPAAESYMKKIEGSEIEVEFLTDDATRHNKGKNVKISGIVAQPLSYLEKSLSHSTEFKTFGGDTGRVVAPAAWVFHKGLTFPKRANKLKQFKDLYGIWYAMTQLEELSKSTFIEVKSFSKTLSKWHRTFATNLESWVEEAAPTDWSQLEAQDPYGALSAPGFRHLIKSLTTVQETLVQKL